MGMLKRRLKGGEEGANFEDEDTPGGELSGDSTTSDDESTSSLPLVDGEETSKVSEDQVSPSPHKIKVMILASRGINARYFFLPLMVSIFFIVNATLWMTFASSYPTQRKVRANLYLSHLLYTESKFDTKRNLFVLNELAELNGCSHILYFEARRAQELFIWASKSPSGPSVRFHVQNISTLEELHLTGNCMKNTRPILTFDPFFSAGQHGTIMKDVLSNIFGTPKNHRKTRPYIDHVIHFAWADGRIWIRNYQIKESVEGECVDGLSLEEIGPRFILHPVRILEGSFAGRSLWVNTNYTPLSALRSAARASEAMKHKQRILDHKVSLLRKKSTVLPEDELDHVFD